MVLSGIEPGEKGSELIAEGIDHIIKNHDYDDEDSVSKLYSKKGSADKYFASDNTVSGWEVSYPVKV